ncbi:hypothetical protein Trydic_g13122 [Trypoxylus dichotomus]
MPYRKNKEIPDGWRNYSNIGVVVRNTRLIPFKTPLKEEVCKKYGLSFSPTTLLKYQPKIKLIIDLTNTDSGRYYDAEKFSKNGVRIEKIKCVGGPTQVPSVFAVEKFIDIVNEFLGNPEVDPESLVGVHCTHGLNRTGYFICKYMIEKLGIRPEDAVKYFQTSRGYSIERKHLINDILRG